MILTLLSLLQKSKIIFSKHVIQIAVFGLFTVSFWLYYSYASNTIETQKTKIKNANLTIENQKLVIEQNKENIESILKINNNIQEAEINLSNTEYHLLNQLKSFHLITKENIELSEQLLNKETKNRIRCLEIATGSIVTKLDQENLANTCKELLN